MHSQVIGHATSRLQATEAPKEEEGHLQSCAGSPAEPGTPQTSLLTCQYLRLCALGTWQLDGPWKAQALHC